MSDKEKLLEVKDLYVSFDTYAGEVQAVRGVSFDVCKGEVVAVVGESGCGKSVTSQTIMRIIPSPPGRIKSGEILFDGTDITKLSDKQMEKYRGSQMGMIFQDPMTSLNPTMKVGTQIAEGLIKHQKLKRKEAFQKAIDMLKLVGIPNPEKRATQYPHELSGGMRQRVVIAIALACQPKLLIADEPTTALDVTIQAQILELMNELKDKLGTSIILITHDLGVVAGMAEKIVVMYAGKIIEAGTVEEIFHDPLHPYTWGLLKSVPRIDADQKGELIPIVGTPPDLFAPPVGCAFTDRCPYAMKICKEVPPDLWLTSTGHSTLCWLQHADAPEIKRPFGTGGLKVCQTIKN